MIVWVARAAAGASLLLAVVMAANAAASGVWQMWAGVVAFGLWAVGWWMLGAHWARHGDGTRVLLDARTGMIAGMMVVVFMVVGLILSTLD